MRRFIITALSLMLLAAGVSPTATASSKSVVFVSHSRGEPANTQYLKVEYVSRTRTKVSYRTVFERVGGFCGPPSIVIAEPVSQGVFQTQRTLTTTNYTECSDTLEPSYYDTGWITARLPQRYLKHPRGRYLGGINEYSNIYVPLRVLRPPPRVLRR